jgi:transposase
MARKVSTGRAAEVLRRARPSSSAGRTRRRLASDLLGDLRRFDRQLDGLDGRIAEAVEETSTSLVEIYGLGPILAAKIVGRVGDVSRFPSKGHFASHTGTAPVEASSGEVVRHRLSRGGDRQLNYALHMVAICQIAHDTRGRAYYRRKVAEGKSGKEALRYLKRRISDAVFQKLRSDLRAVSTTAA